MEKLSLLISELDKVKKSNLVKFIISEGFILFLAIGSFYTNLALTYQIIIFIGFLFVFIILIIIYYFKLKFFSKLKSKYIYDESLFNEAYLKRKSYHLDILDYLNEKFIIEEMLRVLKIKDQFLDQAKIGPWKIIYNRDKTQKFYQNYQNNKLKLNKMHFSQLDNKTIELLTNLGIDYQKVYDNWGSELMYPIYGMLVNDSQVLRRGLRCKEYRISDKIIIKPYEKKLDDEDIIMFHIKQF